MLDYENDGIELDEENEKLHEQLALERIAEIELAIEQTNIPLNRKQTNFPKKRS